jgi:ribosomal protein S18 acetylase RimI-like enzyme
VLVPRLLREARDRGWWDPMAAPEPQPASPDDVNDPPVVLGPVDAATWAGLTLAPRVVPPADPADGHRLVLGTLQADARVAIAIRGSLVVGLAVAADGELLAIGVAPDDRRRGLGRSLIEAIAPYVERAEITVAERDPFDALPRSERASIARNLLTGAGLAVGAADADIGAIDPGAIAGQRR